MKKHILFLSVVFLGLGFETNGTLADGDDQKLPPGPWPSRAPERSTWSVKIDWKRGAQPNGGGSGTPSNASSNNASAENTSPQQMVTVVKTWPVIHESAVDFKGLKWEKWFTNGLEVAVVPTTGRTIISSTGVKDSFLFQDYSKSDFADLDWLDISNYKEKGDWNGVPCFIFEGRMATNPNGPPTLIREDTGTYSKPASPEFIGYKAQEFTVRAYLNCKTLLPCHLEYGDEIRTYTFGATPTMQQTVPALVTTAIYNTQKQKAQNEMAPERPF